MAVVVTEMADVMARNMLLTSVAEMSPSPMPILPSSSLVMTTMLAAMTLTPLEPAKRRTMSQHPGCVQCPCYAAVTRDVRMM